NEIRVYSHTAVIGRELRESVELLQSVRFPLSTRKIDQGFGVQFSHGRDSLDRLIVDLAAANIVDLFARYARFFGELAIGNVQTTLGLADNVGGVVLERNGHG